MAVKALAWAFSIFRTTIFLLLISGGQNITRSYLTTGLKKSRLCHTEPTSILALVSMSEELGISSMPLWMGETYC